MKFLKCVCLCILASAVFFSCGKDGDTGPGGPEGPQGPAGNKSLLDVKPLSAGDKCSNGGFTIKSGVDKNGNNLLDESEIEHTQYVCNGTNASADKQVILRLRAVTQETGSGFTYFNAIPMFNINNYPGVDSIIFIATPYSGYQNGMVKAELMNYNTKEVIANSTLSGGYKPPFVYMPYSVTGNIYSSFPKVEFDLGVKITSSVSYETGYTNGDVLLMLYRK